MDRSHSHKEKKSWAEINKSNREERKKWKEKNILKKIEKEKLKNVKVKEEMIANETQNEIIQDEVSTISIAVPGSILDNAQSSELRTYLAGQIARAACIFQVDEIVVFDDYANESNTKTSTLEDIDGLKTGRRCCIQLARILQYLECPQYLRKFFFPIHVDLKYAGILNPLDAPHHLRQSNKFHFREGVVTNKPVKPGKGSLVNVGLYLDVQVDKLLTAGLRCTVKILPPKEGSKKLKGYVVAPYTPRRETGIYWGYTVRLANTLTQVFSQCPYKNGYDLTIGTSDKGTKINEFDGKSFNHLLIVFGGLQGLEGALEGDESITVDEPRLLFDHYLNVLPNQGSRTIRTEEAILVTLTALSSKLSGKVLPKPFVDVDMIASSSTIRMGDLTSTLGQNQSSTLKRNLSPTLGVDQFSTRRKQLGLDLSRFD